MTKALDYRQWLHIDQYEIGVLARRQGRKRLKITRAAKGIGSGGKKAAWMRAGA
ncbi:hypothetical protein DSM104299_00791 [Baekduia alba]|uniref:hypothetical protein n=1 Tax=Baekduia alba TaxID=2997333 RepID=UPI00234182F2|nr:hypothetical protein [Baekduia alba]WCB92106.1 hypothetical protein DSM104299_00791 [Baekduia alba]